MNVIKAAFAGFFLLLSTALWAAVDINTADSKTLETLDGIGPAKAQDIIEYRTKNGAFKSLADFEKVPGIGPATVEKNRDNISFGGATTKTATKPAKK